MTTITKHFRTYDAAIAFATKQGMQAYGRPYRRLTWIDGTQVPIWSVTLASVTLANAPAAANSSVAPKFALAR